MSKSRIFAHRGFLRLRLDCSCAFGHFIYILCTQHLQATSIVSVQLISHLGHQIQISFQIYSSHIA